MQSNIAPSAAGVHLFGVLGVRASDVIAIPLGHVTIRGIWCGNCFRRHWTAGAFQPEQLGQLPVTRFQMSIGKVGVTDVGHPLAVGMDLTVMTRMGTLDDGR
jgi:hypothetical protein